MSDTNSLPLEVTQLHYLGWPDHGVPKSPADLLNLYKIFRERAVRRNERDERRKRKKR